jgi:hypothetical protein
MVLILTAAALVPQAEATMEVTATTMITDTPQGTVVVVAPVRRGSLAEVVEETTVTVARVARRPPKPVAVDPRTSLKDGINHKTRSR